MNFDLNNLSIIIPTHNRSYFLNQCLTYLDIQCKDLHHKPNIVIIESSDNCTNFSQFENLINVNTFYDPTLGFFEKIYFSSKKISTEFCIINADDDFINLKLLRNIILNINPNVSITSFPYIHFDEKKIINFNCSIKPPIDRLNSKNNYLNLGRSYFPTFYSLRKTETFIKTAKKLSLVKNHPPRLLELFDSFDSINSHGIAISPIPPLARRIHKSSMSNSDLNWRKIISGGYIKTFFDTLTDNFLLSQNELENFEKFISGYLMNKQGNNLTFSKFQVKIMKQLTCDEENIYHLKNFISEISKIISSDINE